MADLEVWDHYIHVPALALYELYQYSEHIKHVVVTDVEHMDATLRNLCVFSWLESITLRARANLSGQQSTWCFQQKLLPSLKRLCILPLDAPLLLDLVATSLHEMVKRQTEVWCDSNKM